MIIQLHLSDFNGGGSNPVTNALNRIFGDVEWHYNSRFIAFVNDGWESDAFTLAPSLNNLRIEWDAYPKWRGYIAKQFKRGEIRATHFLFEKR